MDYVDSPFLRKKHKTDLQSELEMKLRQRRKDGLATGISDDDELAEEIDEDDDSEEDALAQYRMDLSKQRPSNRPSSAKRRSPSYHEMNEIALGDTIRPGGGSRFMKDRGGGGGIGGMPLLSPKGRTSPGMNDKGRVSPGMPSLTSPKMSPKSKGDGDLMLGNQKGRKSPLISQQQPLTKEELIFGRKTPTYDNKRQSPVDNKPWQPPNFRKSPVPEQMDQGQRAPSPGPGLHGRKTPSQEPLLQPISESNTPRSRFSPKPDRKSPTGKDFQGRQLTNGSEVPKPKPRHKTDIFGKTTQEDFDLEIDSPSSQPRFMRKTQTQGLQGRKTPTNTDSTGRKTPTNSDSFGRNTTGRKSPGPSANKEETSKKTKKEEVKKQPSLFDFLGGDTEEPKKNVFKKEEKKTKLLKKDYTEDSVTDETNIREDLLMESKTPSSKAKDKHRQSSQKVADRDKEIPDDSSMCEEFEKDPYGRSFKTKESTRVDKKQTESKNASDVIDQVALEQDKPSTMKPISPNKSLRKDDKIHKPKPRHSLPGVPPTTSTSEMSFNDTMSIRQAVYEEWRQQRIKSAKEQIREKKKKEEEEEKKKEEVKKEKFLENESSYREWLKKKKEVHDPEVKKKKLKEEEKKLEQEKEKEQKKKEAEKNFNLWKEEKEIRLKDKVREERMKKLSEERSVEEKRREKEKENMTAMRGWQRKKEEELRQKAKEQKNQTKETIKIEETQKKVREKEAAKLYEDWLKRKDQTMKKEKRRKYGSTEYIEERPAWSPASKTIPFGR